MRHAVILAGGSGLRLWPMSRGNQPKQLIPFIKGESLLEVAAGRLDGLVPPNQRYVCASAAQREQILRALPSLGEKQFLGESVGRDTLNAVGFSAAVIAKRDPEAVIAVFTADHLIEPVSEFQRIVKIGYAVVEERPNTLVTFGITPTMPTTAYGYLQLGDPLSHDARVVEQFREKPDAESATEFFKAGPECFLWNSGMFVWRASTLLDCIRRYEPDTHAKLVRIAEVWGTPEQVAVLDEIYPKLRKVSVDYGVMEPASRDKAVTVAAVPMPLRWLDVGSWPAFGETLPRDEKGNAVGEGRSVLQETGNTMVVSSDPKHLIATIGCDNLIIVHTPDATLICRADQAEAVKQLNQRIAAEFGADYV